MKFHTTPAQWRQAYRNQLFDHGTSIGQCGLRAKEVALFPVRYALDESPAKGSNQGPNPLPKNWSGAPPELQTRSYTLRQLRDGWLYVLSSEDSAFHEYRVQGNQFTRHPWTSTERHQDVRNNPGTTQPYLLYPRGSRLRIAYSPVQWTWHLCELMNDTAGAQSPWLRHVDLPAYCNSGELEHGAPLTELGNSVADILVHGASIPDFTSTLLPTTVTEPGAPYKAAFEECLVRGHVPEQDTALLVALDDPLALIDDLNMNLSGRLLEQSQFEALHEQPLQSALAVQQLCGVDADAFIPQPLEDPAQRRDYTDDLYGLLRVNDEIEQAKSLQLPEDQVMAGIAGAKVLGDAESRFQAKWGHLPDRDTWRAVLAEWNAKRLWRQDVRYAQMQQYLGQTTLQAQQLQAHCQRSEGDLLSWVNRLGNSAEALYHDSGNEDQASQLLETAHALYINLGNGEGGQRWLSEQAKAPNTLLGLALFNFNPEVAVLIKQVSYNFSTTGHLEDQAREGDGSMPPLNLRQPGDATSTASRLNEIKGVLDLEAVKNSELYRSMSSVGKQALHTLTKVANDQAMNAWHGLSSLLLPSLKGHDVLALAATQVLISSEIATHTQLVFNPVYPDLLQTWLGHVRALQGKIAGAAQVLQRPGHPYDQRAARIALHQLEAQMQTLLLHKPNQITALATGNTTRLHVNRQTILGWLTDLGRNEVLAQRHLRQTGSRQHQPHNEAWANQYLGQALPVLLVGLNLWNFFNTTQQAQNNGRFSADEWRKIGSSAAYTANALVALWVIPGWHQAGKMFAPLGRETAKVAEAGYHAWKAAMATAAKLGDSATAATAEEFATFSKRLILRTVTWATLGAIAAGLEAWQLSIDERNATSEEETNALSWKRQIVIGMAITAATQTIGAFLGYWFSFTWVMSTPITILLTVLGIAYFLSSILANMYKREGLRLWLHRCSWGLAPEPAWAGNNGHKAQMNALLETLQRPSVLGKSVLAGYGTPRWSGFWLQIQLPHTLAGRETHLQPAIIDTYYSIDDRLRVTHSSFYEQFLIGSWIDPKLLGQLPNRPGSTINPADYTYAATDQHRLWQVWIETPQSYPVLELEVSYPFGILQRNDGRGYMFRIALTGLSNEADRENNAFSGELNNDIVLTIQSTQWVSLTVPHHQTGEE
ncbi:T6SS effector BTH_I2691 family protein [Pseudomonas sp. UM16]|uniref:T6SS effector BTH_I2691 family protein n=1 Tax=Pseudomonas sp. UM16 TaxID=3158962 RepID=UPI00398FA029